jgi:hypothetical protein
VSDDPFKPPLPYADSIAGIAVLRHEVREMRVTIEEVKGKVFWMSGHVEAIENDLWYMILFIRAFVYAVCGLIITAAVWLYFN